MSWLAFVAIWLTVVAPVISQLAWAGGQGGSGMACAESMAHAAHPLSPQPSLPSIDKCGYCTLVGHSPVVITTAWVPLLLPRAAGRPVALPDARAIRRHAWLAPTPRGPPGSADA